MRQRPRNAECFTLMLYPEEMRPLLALLFVAQCCLSAQSPDDGVRHEFVIQNFHTESGAVLPEAKIVYGTWGHLNAAKDNLLLLTSHYLANYN